MSRTARLVAGDSAGGLPASARMAALERRLESYWRLEAINVVLVPATLLYLALPATGTGVMALALTLAANMALLVAGAAYWRASLRRLRGEREVMDRLLPRLDRSERPLILLTASGCIATLVAALEGWAAPVFVALGAAILSVLEYINYFRIQLQHFDHGPDFARLLRGRGWRPAHLARDLAAWRRLR